MAKSQVTTFYSYKGGSGRSMTLANVAWALATNGEEVLVIDWDLEAPGLHRYFHPFLRDPDQGDSEGLIDRVWEYVVQLDDESNRKNRFKLADCSDIVQPLELPIAGKGHVHFIGAGQQDDRYSAKIGGLDWNAFYQRFDGEAFINALMTWARNNYTHILIDSRTGVADTAGICTSQVPDALVFCLVYNRQSIEGTAAVARSIKEARKKSKRTAVKMEFVPSRVEERSAVEAARRHAAQWLLELIDGGPGRVEQILRRAEVRNFPWCAFEEKLAVFEEYPDERGSLLDVMHDLARRITGSGKIQIRQVDPEILSSYWRRAAFDDPRLFDLRAVSEQPTLEGWNQIQFWLTDAHVASGERPEWLMALAEAAMRFMSRRDGQLFLRDGDTVALLAVDLAHRAYSQDPSSYMARYALVLDDMAGVQHRTGNLTKALQFSERAESLWERDGSIISQWRRARLMDRRAAILDALGRADDTISIYRKIASIYLRIDQRALPVGNQLEPARIQRLLARKLMERGDWLAARNAILSATKLFEDAPPAARERAVGEIIEILTTRLQIAVQTDSDKFDEVAREVLVTAGQFLPKDGGPEQIMSELFLCQAELLARKGKFNEALFRIASTPVEFQNLPRTVLQRAKILLESGLYEEAAEALVSSIRRGAPLTDESLAVFQRAINGSPKGKHHFDELLGALLANEDKGASSYVSAIRTLTDSMSPNRTNFSEFVPLLQSFIHKSI